MTTEARVPFFAQMVADLEETAVQLGEQNLADRLGAVGARLETVTTVDEPRPRQVGNLKELLAEVRSLADYAASDQETRRYAAWLRGALPADETEGARVDLGNDPSSFAREPSGEPNVSVVEVENVAAAQALVAVGMAVAAQPGVSLLEVSPVIPTAGGALCAVRHTGVLASSSITMAGGRVAVRFELTDVPADVDLAALVAERCS